LRRFRDEIRDGPPAITAELTLQRESGGDDIRRQADALAPWVDALQVTDNPYAWVQMSSLAAASILIDHGVDALPIMTCRDRNRAALSADLRGMQAVGVTSLVLMRGHRVPANHAVPASTVFDLTGRELIGLTAGLANEQNEAPFIGTGARVFRPTRGWRAESLTARAQAGARFVQTQLCFNLDILRHYMRRFREARLEERFAVMVSLAPLPSADTAEWIKRNLSDTRLPDSVIRRLEQASDPSSEGIRLCAELMQEAAMIPGVSGISLMTVGNPDAILETIKASGLRSSS
jgi:methylenetetrahydrofolate reductase (NADPH)